MARKSIRILIKVVDSGDSLRVEAGDAIYVLDGVVEKEASAALPLDLLAAAWPLIEQKEIAFAAGDNSPANGTTKKGVRFVVQPAPEEQPIYKTRRFEKSAVEAAAGNDQNQKFLARLPRSLVQSLERVADSRLFRPGQDIISEGQAASCLFMVHEGEVEVVKSGSHEEAILAILKAGDIFGEMSILTGDPTSATVRARTHCQILALPKERLEELLVTQPLLGREFSRLLAERMRRTSQTVEADLDRSIFGSLAMVDPADLVQTMSASRRTGKLSLRKGHENGDIFFDNGRLVGARFGKLLGIDAFNFLLHWRDGRFTFEKGAFKVEGEMEGDTMSLLMEAMRLIDEETRGEQVSDS